MSEKVNEYINHLLNKSHYEPNDKDAKHFQCDKIGYIVKKLTRKKFRKYALHEKTKEDLTLKVKLSLADNKPLKFVIPFGGYKHFWNPSYPNTNFAELFHFVGFQEYIAPVVAYYEAGVEIEYVSEDLILPYMNNYPEKDLDTYDKNFRELIKFYSSYLPSNVKIKLIRIGDDYDKEKLVSEVLDLLPERRKEFEKLSEEEKKFELHRSYRSIQWDGKEDLTQLSESEKEEVVIRSRITELAYYDVEAEDKYIGDYYVGGNHICICFSFGTTFDNIDHFLTIATSKTSIVDFWIGTGVLKPQGESFIATILSRKQYEELESDITKVSVDIDCLLNGIPLLPD